MRLEKRAERLWSFPREMLAACGCTKIYGQSVAKIASLVGIKFGRMLPNGLIAHLLAGNDLCLAGAN